MLSILKRSLNFGFSKFATTEVLIMRHLQCWLALPSFKFYKTSQQEQQEQEQQQQQQQEQLLNL